MKDTEDRKIQRVFLDTNVLLDYLYFRGDEALATEYLFDACVRGGIECCIAAHSLCNMFYILRKDFSIKQRNMIVQNLCALCSVQPISGKIIEKAIESGYSPDLEDALQMQCAVECKADCLLTEDRKGFAKSPIKVMHAHELIRELGL